MQARFDVLDGFEALPIGMSLAEADAHVRALVGQQGLGQPPFGEHEMDRRFVGGVHALSGMLQSVGALYMGNTVGTINGERSMATLLVTVRRFAYGPDARVAAEGALQAVVAARGEGWTGGVHDLPCGPAAVATGTRTFLLPRRDGDKPPIPLSFGELQAFVPVPDHPSLTQQYLLMASFVTPSLHHWNAYMPPLVRLLRSITFVPDDPARGGSGEGTRHKSVLGEWKKKPHALP